MPFSFRIGYCRRRSDLLSSAFLEVRNSIQHFVSTVPSSAQMYIKNFGLALLEVAFSMHSVLPASLENRDDITPRVSQLGLFIEKHCTKISVFDDVKGYAERLSISEARCLLDKLFPLLISKVRMSRRTVAFRSSNCQMPDHRALSPDCPSNHALQDPISPHHLSPDCRAPEEHSRIDFILSLQDMRHRCRRSNLSGMS